MLYTLRAVGILMLRRNEKTARQAAVIALNRRRNPKSQTGARFGSALIVIASRKVHPSAKGSIWFGTITHVSHHFISREKLLIKEDVACNVRCGCGALFYSVGRFEGHLRHCPAMQETGSPRHMQTLGLRKHLSKLAMDDLLQSERSQVASICESIQQ